MALDPQLWTAIGCGLGMFLSLMGSAIASATAGVYAMKGPNLKAFVPIVMAGVLAIYGLIIGVLLASPMNDDNMTTVQGYKNFAAGLVVGGATLASGLGQSRFVGYMNEGKCTPITATAPEVVNEGTPLVNTLGLGVYEKPSFVRAILSLIYIEAIGFYGLIVALILVQQQGAK